MSALHSLAPLALAATFLAACLYESPMSGATDGTADSRQIDAAVAGTTPQQAQAFLAGRTWRSAEGTSGQAIHYSTSHGRDFLWRYGQSRILAGQWRIDTGPDTGGRTVSQLCLRYPGEAINPLSNTPGDQWHCRAAGMAFHFVRERVDGDPLKLAERSQAPFVMGYGRETISQLQARIAR